MEPTYGVVALGRPTFDVPFANEMMTRAFAALDSSGIRTVGARALQFDREAAARALDEIAAAGPVDLLLILQVTFTDASMTVKIASESTAPVAIWALPEPRIGGRLRLNAYCGLNLAAHALGRAGHAHASLYADPQAPGLAARLRSLRQEAAARRAAGMVKSRARPVDARERSEPTAERAADRVLRGFTGARIALVGQHPDGFDTCEYDPALLDRLFGVRVTTVPLGALFDKARAADAARVAVSKSDAAEALVGLEEVDQEQLDRSFRVFCALEDVQREQDAKGLAVRCWPEMFTEYGCAACGPMAMMNEKRVPAACEADVHGALSQLVLQELAAEPAWMADMVDITVEQSSPHVGTAVLWHCGLAPLSMRDPEVTAEATIHTNRKMPLLHQFPIKPGRITLARLSRARNETKLMVAGAEVVRAPMAFTGCSGTIRFDRPLQEVADTIIEEGLEHHFALAYGDHKPALLALAARWNLPVLELA